jgi:Outer membrane lipoprotein carrier protein LolA-like
MNWRRAVRTSFVALVPAWATVAAAQPITVAQVQRLLQDAPKRELRFQETRESQWLSAPVETSGSIRASATMLEKTVEHPRRETWRILDDRMQLIEPGSATARQFMYSEAPAVAVLANALRRVMVGDLQALDLDFQLVPGGDQRQWTLQLTPRRLAVARFLKQLELQGAGAQLQLIVIVEGQGDRTTTRLIHEP